MQPGSQKILGAAVQAAPVYLDLDGSISKASSLIREAAQKGAKIIAFPETWLPGYPWWIWLGAPVWGMRFLQQYYENSLVKRSPQWKRLQEIARENEIMVVMGYSEREGGSLYMGQAIFGADGAVIASRRKLKPTHVERSVFGEGDGSDLAVHETPIGRVGALCCWEHLQPLSKYAMYSQNEQIHVAAWPSFNLYRDIAYALGAEVNNAASRIYAVEGACFVLAPCATISEEMVALLVDSPDKSEFLKVGGGHAMIYGPDGRELAKPLPDTEEGVLYAELDLGSIVLSKAVADPSGHYSRPDVTRLLLDGSRKQRVERSDRELPHHDHQLAASPGGPDELDPAEV